MPNPPTRQNSVLFNGDPGFLFTDAYPPMKEGERFEAWRLHEFVDLLADSGVDTLAMCPNGQVPWYPSRAVRSVLHGYRRGDRPFVRGHFRQISDRFTEEMLQQATDGAVRMLDRLLDLHEAGVDWLAEIVTACRRRGISPWVSVRMNDLHGAVNWEQSFINVPPQRDPACRLSGRTLNPRNAPNRKHMAMSYAHPAVRDYQFSLIRELVEEYDFEGAELDWLRCPFCCEPPASAETVAMMNNWIGHIRQLANNRGAASGREYLLGLRVPPRLGLLRNIGLDVPGLAELGLVDFITPSNFWQTSWDVPHDELRHQLPEHVAIYGGIEDAPNWMHAFDPATERRGARLLSASAPLLRGNAAGKLVLGADGVECFNFFCTDEARGLTPPPSRRQADYSALAQLGNLEALRGQVKHYTFASMRGGIMFPAFEYAEQLPQSLEPGDRRAFRIPMCREPLDRGLHLVLQLIVRTTDPLPALGVSFNGSWPSFAAEPTDRLLLPTGIYTHQVAEHRALNYRLNLPDVREGWNEILVFHGDPAGSATMAALVGIELAVLAQNEKKPSR